MAPAPRSCLPLLLGDAGAADARGARPGRGGGVLAAVEDPPGRPAASRGALGPSGGEAMRRWAWLVLLVLWGPLAAASEQARPRVVVVKSAGLAPYAAVVAGFSAEVRAEVVEVTLEDSARRRTGPSSASPPRSRRWCWRLGRWRPTPRAAALGHAGARPLRHGALLREVRPGGPQHHRHRADQRLPPGAGRPQARWPPRRGGWASCTTRASPPGWWKRRRSAAAPLGLTIVAAGGRTAAGQGGQGARRRGGQGGRAADGGRQDGGQRRRRPGS